MNLFKMEIMVSYPGGQKGSISLLAVLSLAVIILAIPITVKLVQQRQEIRKEAVYPSPSPELPSPSPECKGENDSCGDTADCCGGLQCASLPGGKFCISPTCDEGLRRCSGNFIQECQSGVWTDTQRCDASCDPRTVSCVKVCNPGETRCAEDVLETCASDGSGWSGKSCAYGCNKGACLAPSPSPSPSLAPSPSPTGSPSSQCNCAPGEECVAVPGGYACLAPTCINGETRCSGSFVQTCQNGQWQDTERCETGCSGGSCLRVCIPGYTRCVGNEQQTCGSTGGGWSVKSCAHGCSSGRCLPAPSPGVTPLPSPSPAFATLPSPTPAVPMIQPTVPLGGITIGYGLPQFGSTPEGPYGFELFEPCTDPTGLSCEFDPLLALGFSTPGLASGVGLLVTSPEWAPFAYVTAQTYISTSPEWVQRAIPLATQGLELGGTGLTAYECSRGNQNACMIGVVGGQIYTESMMAMAASYADEAIEITDDVIVYRGAVPVEESPSSGRYTPEGIRVRDRLMQWAKEHGITIRYSPKPARSWFTGEPIAGSAEVGSKVITIYPDEAGEYAANINTMVVRHEIEHAMGGRGQLRTRAEVERLANECFACKNTVDWLIESGYPPDHPYVNTQMEYWRSAHDRLIEITGGR